MASRFHEILRKDVFSDIETRPCYFIVVLSCVLAPPIYPYFLVILHWHCGTHTTVLTPKQPCKLWMEILYESTQKCNITTTYQSTENYVYIAVSPPGTFAIHGPFCCNSVCYSGVATTFCIWTSYQIRKLAGCTCARNAGNVFPDTDFKGNS